MCTARAAGQQLVVTRYNWRRILLWSVPAAIGLQVLVPVGWALLQAPAHGLVCRASMHGTRAVPCGFVQLVSEWTEAMAWFNLALLGAPTLVAYLLCVLIAFIGTKLSRRY